MGGSSASAHVAPVCTVLVKFPQTGHIAGDRQRGGVGVGGRPVQVRPAALPRQDVTCVIPGGVPSIIASLPRLSLASI